mmetsp:Transcript_15266/g.17779  ORF Transcript_15266/g.17779 Transcript_15266/m.17779 type:complete len:588 (-) Transcript_15266:55-1818(-)
MKRNSNIQPTDLQSISLRRCPNSSTSVKSLHALIASVPSRNSTSSSVNCINESWRQVTHRVLSQPHEITLLDYRGRTALHAVCTKNPALQLIRTILSISADANFLLEMRDKHGRTPLALAIVNNAKFDVIAMLLERNKCTSQIADERSNLPLHLACMGGTRDKAANIVSTLVDTFQEATSSQNWCEKTPLHLAVECVMDVEVVGILLKACPEAVLMDDKFEDTPLHLAIKQNSSFEIIKRIVLANPCVCMKKKHGSLPLHLAIVYQSPTEIIETLCINPECVTAIDDIGRTALHMSLDLTPRPVRTINALLRTEPKVVKQCNKAGNTPLDVAYLRYKRCINSLGEVLDINARSANEVKWWRLVVLLLRAFVQGPAFLEENNTAASKPFNVIGSLLETKVPIEVVKTALKLNRDEMRPTYESEKLPIFKVISGPAKLEDKSVIISLILKEYPESAIERDSHGAYLLTRVAEYGFLKMPALKDVLSNNPEAISFVDVGSQMPPFLLAAVQKGNTRIHSDINDKAGYNSNSISNVDKSLTGVSRSDPRDYSNTKRMFMSWDFEENLDLIQLNMIYYLLRQGPYVLESVRT